MGTIRMFCRVRREDERRESLSVHCNKIWIFSPPSFSFILLCFFTFLLFPSHHSGTRYYFAAASDFFTQKNNSSLFTSSFSLFPPFFSLHLSFLSRHDSLVFKALECVSWECIKSSYGHFYGLTHCSLNSCQQLDETRIICSSFFSCSWWIWSKVFWTKRLSMKTLKRKDEKKSKWHRNNIRERESRFSNISFAH